METRSWPPLGLGVIGHAWGNFLAGNSPQTGVFFFSTGKEGEKLVLFKKFKVLNKLSQELQMLSSVTLYCNVVMLIVMF